MSATTPHLPIYIPSKGRADKCLTAQLLLKENVNFSLVVEPQDADDYRLNFPGHEVIVMDQNNKGIAYARNWCKNISTLKGEPAHWQPDDNIKSFRVRKNGKNVICSVSEVLSPVELFFHSHKNVGMACLRHTMFAFSQTKDLSFNQCMYSAFITVNNIGFYFRDKTIEDADYTLQVLSSGLCTVIFNRLLMEKITTGKMKGGNTEISHGGDGRLLRAKMLCAQWPDCFSIRWKNGLPKVHPLGVWSRFKQRPVRLFNGT